MPLQKTFHVRVDDSLHAQTHRLAGSQGRTTSDLIRALLAATVNPGDGHIEVKHYGTQTICEWTFVCVTELAARKVLTRRQAQAIVKVLRKGNPPCT